MTRPELRIFPSLGREYSIGWERRDLEGVVHVFAQAEPGAPFSVEGHWPCPVCDAHGYSEADFREQVAPLLARAQAKLRRLRPVSGGS